MNTDIRSLIQQRVDECLVLARQLYPTYRNAPVPTVEFFRRGIRFGAAISYIKLEFNLHIAENGGLREILDLVVPHEIAHIVCNYTGYGKKHNKGWRRVCITLGGDGTRCSSFTDVPLLPARRTRRYKYVASCGTICWVGSTIHNRIQNQGPARTVRATKGRITSASFTGECAG